MSLQTWVSRLPLPGRTDTQVTSDAITRLSNSHCPGRPTSRFGLWWYRMQLRHDLSQLSDRQLHDAGVNPEWVRRETAKHFWQD